MPQFSTRRSALAAAVAASLAPLARDAQAKHREGRRRDHRRRGDPCYPIVNDGCATCFRRGCLRGLCTDPDRDCGGDGLGCRCLGAGYGIGVCVVPDDNPPPCGDGCPEGSKCIETCAHPGETRCYVYCPCGDDLD